MATTVTYKGSTLTALTNQTKILKTAGKYMEDDVTIEDISSGGSAIVVIDEPDEHGGIIKHITAVDLSNDTVSAATLLEGYTAHDYQGNAITGTYDGGTFQDKTTTPTESTQTITPDYGYNGLSSVTVNPIPSSYIIPSGSLSITSNNTYDVTSYASAVVNVSSTINNQNKTVNPSTSQQQVTADTGYSGLGTVTVTAMPSMTLPTAAEASATSSYTSKATVSRSTSDQYINIPTGYNSAGAYYKINAVPNGTAGTPTATKGTVSSNSVTVTPSVTNTTGYITGSTISGTGVTVSASELVSGTKSITSNGTGIDVTNYASVDVNVSGGSVNNQSKSVDPDIVEQEITYDAGYTGLETVTISAIPTETKSNINPTTSSQTITPTAGKFLTSVQINAMPTGTAGTPTATKGTVSNNSISVTPSVTNVTGYITGGTKTGTAVTVSASELVSGTKSITSNGTGIDVTNYASVDVAIPSDINNQNKTVTPTESEQSVTADSGYTGLGTVTVSAISDTYVGSAIDRRDDSDLTASGATVTVPAGYYEDTETKSISSGTATTPTTSITANPTISVNTTTGLITATASGSKSITPNVSAGYISTGTAGTVSVTGSNTSQLSTVNGSTITPTETEQTAVAANKYTLGAVKVGAISDTYVGSGITRRDDTDLTASGATVSVPAGYYESNETKSVSSGSATGPSNLSGSSASISTGTNTITLTKTGVTTTPTVTPGYVSSATASTATVTLTASATVDPTPTASGATVTIPAGYYTAQTTKDVSTMTLPTSASASATSGYTSKATISRSTSDQYINIPTGYNTAGGYYKISAVANGSATAPASISGTSATVSTGTNTLTLTKTVSVTPTVSAGYVSSGTAGNSNVSLTASVTTKGATTYHPSTTAQTISSGTYLTGTQTINAVTTSNLSASNIVSGVTIKVGDSSDDDCVASVTGNVVLQNYYTGSSTPSSSLGSNGDLYLQI